LGLQQGIYSNINILISSARTAKPLITESAQYFHFSHTCGLSYLRCCCLANLQKEGGLATNRRSNVTLYRPFLRKTFIRRRAFELAVDSWLCCTHLEAGDDYLGLIDLDDE